MAVSQSFFPDTSSISLILELQLPMTSLPGFKIKPLPCFPECLKPAQPQPACQLDSLPARSPTCCLITRQPIKSPACLPARPIHLSASHTCCVLSLDSSSTPLFHHQYPLKQKHHQNSSLSLHSPLGLWCNNDTKGKIKGRNGMEARIHKNALTDR